MLTHDDHEWYKDAVIYQLHVKAFFDGNNDGIGDFAGLMQKLEYVQDLGVTCIWLLPFYPSPLRDDGYDIQDYRSVNPSYGVLRDVKRFIAEAHRRGLRVITELVINHTSDQHPWFKRARAAKKGSKLRDWYVWSDSDQLYRDARIIFLDTEPSNWTWDPVAQQYFWHRFYSHQPDLNFDNPRVLREVLNVMHFWLDMGIDGLRLDAIPYLIERDGTNCENLAETHDVLKKIRKEIDEHYPGRMLLAEANQWPEDVLPYFGDGDECHMAFHFPLMPRMYMAIAQEDRHPVADILRQTPDIPANCQWGVFLRNHDELTLEMVTDQERDYLWNTYAADRRARLNLGIRRRLAPLMENDRRKIELMYGLLFSMPGTPIVYYGDEIGMGDNIFLGDRDGVRTPMQWSPDRNGGFSRSDPARLYLPAIQDPVYGYGALNVEQQSRSPSSLLNWMRRMIATRQQHKAFGRGTLRILYPSNRKVLAYLREHEGETILCVANLSRSPQAVELNMAEFRDHVPIELLGNTPFPPLGDLPYLLTLPGHGFYWFLVAQEAEAPRWHEPIPEPLPDLVTVVMQGGWKAIGDARANRDLVKDVLPAYLPKQRWFGAKDSPIATTHVTNWAQVGDYCLTEIQVGFTDGTPAQHYFLPLAANFEPNVIAANSPLLPYTVARGRRGPKVGAIHDASVDPGFAPALIEALRAGQEVAASSGTLRFAATSRFAEVEIGPETECRRLGVEQSNTSILVGDKGILKLYRKLERGTQPELEIARFLTEVAHFANTPPLLGSVEHVEEDGTATALGALVGFVRNQGDGWVYTLNYLEREFERLHLLSEEERHQEDGEFGVYRVLAETLGRRTAEMHRAFATETDDPAFAPEPVTASDMRAWGKGVRRQAEAALRTLSNRLDDLDEAVQADARTLLARRDECLARIDGLAATPFKAAKTRVHGDYHLGQVLVVQNDVSILDFEGEPRRSLEERRAKTTPFKDVAGMLRSFDYAAWAAVIDMAARSGEDLAEWRPLAEEWRTSAVDAFMSAYQETIAGCASYPADEAAARDMLDLFLLDKGLYEIGYEAANRPTWLSIPLKGVLGVLDAGSAVLQTS